MLRAAVIFFILGIVSLLFGITGIPQSVNADETIIETAKEVSNDTKRAAKQSVRVIKDKTCRLISGKMECQVQKAKHAIQKTSDDVADVID